MQYIYIAIMAVFFLNSLVRAQDEIDATKWEFVGEGTELVSHMGRPAIKIARGVAILKDAAFKNGTIEYDLAMPEERGFAGVFFRQRGEEEAPMAEHFYMRSHLSGKPDSTQYTPVFNGVVGWQIYAGPRYASPTPYKYGDWNHVKLVVKDDKMDVYINSDSPVLHVDPLLHGMSEGGFRLMGFLQTYYFSNIRITPTDDVTLVGKAAPVKAKPKGLITKFRVGAESVEDSKVEGRAWLDKELLDQTAWLSMAGGETGALNLARVTALTEKENTALVKLTLNATKARTVKLKYGFSDRVTVFLNGHAVAYDDDTYMSRDYRFLGTMGLFDSVFLPLKAGDNDVVFAISEGFGGWGIIAAIEDQTGVTIR